MKYEIRLSYRAERDLDRLDKPTQTRIVRRLLAILGEVKEVRDLTFYLATLYYSATKLGIDARKLFADVASLAPSSALQSGMRGFPLRAPQSRELSAFNLRETTTDEGFDFVQAQGGEDPVRG